MIHNEHVSKRYFRKSLLLLGSLLTDEVRQAQSDQSAIKKTRVGPRVWLIWAAAASSGVPLGATLTLTGLKLNSLLIVCSVVAASHHQICKPTVT